MAYTYRYLTREQWGGEWARPPIGEKQLDGELYVHHSAGNPWSTWDAIRAFQTLNTYAIDVKGYSFLDYDILVHEHTASGLITIGEGRGEYLSAATADRNEPGEAICALGYFHPGHQLSMRPSEGMLEGIARGIKIGVEKGWISRDHVILGHRQNPAHPGATGCPGDYLFEKLPQIRARVGELLNPTNPPKDSPMYKAITAPGPFAFRMKGYANVVAVINGLPQPVTNDNKHLFGLNDAALTEVIQKPVPPHADSVAWLRSHGILMTASNGGV